MKWITHSHVDIDGVACPWLIKRFIDSEAEFIFAPESKVHDVSEREIAIAFASPGATYNTRGDLCTFSVLLEEFKLTDKALHRLGRIVNAAATNHVEQDPIAAGLSAISAGFGLRFPDDEENIAYQFNLYDALYSWCCLQQAKE
ncbi:hypothetical protein DSLASN_49240 [Desulfoluna limicola]|uniref:ChrB C-terminal domain-containing protein n=1 Tax=Desulfoluna limicola TaxID=2810562 RepID=A0ABM7PPK6_9BACT|nr:chromate resistance protein ChrB domain-containing protein [Desulfoluna limicola]BCS99292.1 hypothetical protein DSLASN_49240 [Desulfoluna limicola]